MSTLAHRHTGGSVSAATLTRLGGGSLRAWFREVVRLRAAPRWYAAVIGSPILLVAALTGVVVLMRATHGRLARD